MIDRIFCFVVRADLQLSPLACSLALLRRRHPCHISCTYAPITQYDVVAWEYTPRRHLRWCRRRAAAQGPHRRAWRQKYRMSISAFAAVLLLFFAFRPCPTTPKRCRAGAVATKPVFAALLIHAHVHVGNAGNPPFLPFSRSILKQQCLFKHVPRKI